MPWELTIRRGDGLPLGETSAVSELLKKTVRGIKLIREPSGKEKLARASFEYPQVLREFLESQPEQTIADYEGNGFSLQFYLGPDGPLASMDVEVRGSGNPMTVLAPLCRSQSWLVEDLASGTLLELSEADPDAWTEFQDYRDDAVRKLSRPVKSSQKGGKRKRE